MKKKIFSYNFIIILLLIVLAGLVIAWKFPKQTNKNVHVGIAVYSMDDTYMQNYVEQLESAIESYDFSGKKIVYEIFDAQGSVNRQKKQLQYVCKQDFDVLLVNLVKPASAASLLNEASDKEIPVVLFNREPDEKDLSISDNIWYVGTDGKKAGILQGGMLIDAWKSNKKSLDCNQNAQLDYILIEGEESHYDTIRRTNGFLDVTRNIQLNQLGDLFADWDRNQCYSKLESMDFATLKNAEAIICNNDDMALGAYDFYKNHDIKIPIIIGINNISEMSEKVASGKIFATIDNDVDSQISHICSLLDKILSKSTDGVEQVWYSEPFIVQK